MKLKRNERIVLKVWINDAVFADEKWTAMTAVDGDSVYVHISDPGSSNTMKIKITELPEAKRPIEEKKEPEKKEPEKKSEDDKSDPSTSEL